MKGLTAVGVVGAIALAGVGAVMAATNPGQDSYEAFATQSLSTYLEQNVCAKAPKDFGLKKQCVSFLESNQAEIRQIISSNTQRQNYLIFSIYTTDLSVSSLLPSYHFETIAVGQQFHVYQAKQTGGGF